MGMFNKFAGIPAGISGFRKLALAVKSGEVKNKHAKSALRALAAERTTVEGTKLGKALAACEAGEWKQGKKDSGDAPEPKAKVAKATGERMFEDLSGLERHRALKGEAERLGLATGGKSADLESRILAGVPAKAKARKSKAKAKAKAVAPDAAVIADIATKAALAAVAAWVKANA